MQVKSTAECSKGSILHYFQPPLSYHLSLRSLFCLFLSSPFTHFFLLFDFILNVPSTIFSYVGTGLVGLNQYQARIHVSCSKTQHSEASEAQTSKHSTTEPLCSFSTHSFNLYFSIRKTCFADNSKSDRIHSPRKKNKIFFSTFISPFLWTILH